MNQNIRPFSVPSREDRARGCDADARTISDWALIALRKAVRQVVIEAKRRGRALVV